jgi:hypothetical protein
MKQRASSTTNANLAAAGMTPPESAGVVSLVIYGAVVSMKNRRRLLKSRRTGKMFSAKSEDAVKYANDFILQVPGWAKQGIGSPKALLSATLTVYHVDMRSDLDCA